MACVRVARRPAVTVRPRSVPVPRSDRQEVRDGQPTAPGLPRGREHHGARHVLAVRGDRVVGGREAEGAGGAVEDRAEHARVVRGRDAEPLDAAGRRDETGVLAVRQERVVGDLREVRAEVIDVRRTPGRRLPLVCADVVQHRSSGRDVTEPAPGRWVGAASVTIASPSIVASRRGAEPDRGARGTTALLSFSPRERAGNPVKPRPAGRNPCSPAAYFRGGRLHLFVHLARG